MPTIEAIVREVNRDLVPRFQVNEQILSARMIDVEQTTLIE